MLKTVILGSLSLCIGMTAAAEGKAAKSCKALALSGGGSKGAFEAGALYGLVMNDPDKTNYAYDVVTGVSAGAINTGAIAVFKPGDEVALVQFLSDTWAGINDANVYKQWSPLGILTGLFSESGIFDDQPLLNFLSSVLEQFQYVIQRRIAISCVDVVTGTYTVFNETTSDPVKAIVSSASLPALFPHQVWSDGVVCMDGGTVWNTNLASAIQRCEELVDDHSQITIDVIVCQDNEISTWNDQGNAFNSFQRFTDIQSFYKDISDVYDLMTEFPEVNYRYFIQPSQPLPGSLQMLNFDNTTNTWPMQMLGRLDGENAVKDGPGYMFGKMKEWEQSPDLQKQYPTIGDFITKIAKGRAEVHRQERRHQNSTIEPMSYEEEYAQMLKKYNEEQKLIQ